MKKVLLPVTVLVALAIAFTSCNMNSPKDTAQKWLTAFYHMDYETAKKYSTEDTKKLLATFEQFSALTNDTVKQHMMKLQIQIKDVAEKGDTAMVNYILVDPKDPKDAEAPKEQKLKLIKQQGKWLVAKSKQDDMGDEPAGGDQAAPMPADSAAAPMPADTTAAPK